MAAIVATAALALVSWVAGFHDVGGAFAAFTPEWLALVVAGQVVALGGYTIAYRAAALVRDGPELSWSATAKLVAAGFAPFAPRGGFGVDREALQTLAARGGDPEAARAADAGAARGGDGGAADHPSTIRVLGLGSLEYALLAPTAWICALVGLGMAHEVPLGFSLPWAVCVPIGLGLALWAARPRRRRKLEPGRGRAWLATALEGVDVIRRLALGPARLRAAYVGMAVYWVGDIGSFYGALRCVGGQIGFVALVLAYASGYAATRRTLPFAGVGITEAMLAYFTSLMHVALGPAIAAVAVYRAANLMLPALPALHVWPRVLPLVEQRESQPVT